jgi:hypothetical protein
MVDMSGTSRSDSDYYIYCSYSREGHHHPFVKVLKVESLGDNPWMVSVGIDITNSYIENYFPNEKDATAAARQVVSALKKRYPGVYKLN